MFEKSRFQILLKINDNVDFKKCMNRLKQIFEHPNVFNRVIIDQS